MKWSGLFWFVVGAGGCAALLVVGLPLLVFAIVLLRRPPGRRPVLRRLSAGVLLTVDAAMLVVTLAAFFAPRLCENILLAYVRYSETYHLSAPRVLAGVHFPAGSTVFMDGDDIDHGTLPVPTVIAGVPLVGEFVANHEAVALGTLASPAEVAGVPCGAGDVSFSTDGSVSCLLGRSFAFAGHGLAVGQRIGINVIAGFGRWLDVGTLAGPERLLDVTWPAGSVLSGIQDEAARPQGSPGLPNLRVAICLMPNQTVPMDGATLHGAMTYVVQREKSWLTPGCNTMNYVNKSVLREGYIEVGTDRFAQGERPNGDAHWHWSNGDDAPATR